MAHPGRREGLPGRSGVYLGLRMESPVGVGGMGALGKRESAGEKGGVAW